MEPLAATIDIALPQGGMSAFYPLLRRGIWFEVGLGRSLESVLVQDCGIDPDYLQHRVQTIFLNGNPVDDLQAPLNRPGQTVALSAAMPGLVGATMRRGGYFAGLREGISHRCDAEGVCDETGWLLLKLYNFPATELAPSLLAQGIILETSATRELIQSLDDSFWGGGAEMAINGEGVASREEALGLLGREGLIRLRVSQLCRRQS